MAPNVRYCASTPVITTGIGGQPETLMIGLSLMRSLTATAPVGFGLAPGVAPNAERVGAADREQVLAPVLLHRTAARILGRLAGGGLQGMLIVERDRLEDQAF